MTAKPVVANFTDLQDTPASITALEFVRGNAGGTALEFVAANAAITLQNAYDASTSPEITLDATRGALTIRDNATPVGNLLEVQDNSGDNFFSVSPTEISMGQSARRWGRLEQVDATGGFSMELFPDDFSRTTATGTSFGGFFTSAARTITLNIPGGGGIGNDTAPAGMNFAHTVRFEDTGFLFAAQLLINAAVRVECAANTVGPLYLFLDQYKTYADGGSRICTQHNAMRAQPSWGPNINGGSITQTSAQLYFASITVDGTVGSATVTAADYFVAFSPNLIAGGTIGTFNVFDIRNIIGPTTIRGINSAMANGTFINHTGVAVSAFAGDIHMNNGVSLVLGTVAGNRVELLRSAAGVMRMIGVGGTNNEGLDWDFDPATVDTIALTSSTGAGLGINLAALSIGTTPGDPLANWQFALTPGVKTVTLAGDFSRALFSAAANVTFNAAMTNGFSWIVNEPAIVLGTGSVVNAGVMLIQGSINVGTNRCGLLITSNPSGGTLNHALRVTLGASRFDGRVDINNGIALGGGAVPTLGTIGGSGPTAAAQAQWVEIDIGGTPHWIAVWT